MRSVVPSLAALSALLVACESVPTLRFVTDDAGTQHDADRPDDGGLDAEVPDGEASCVDAKPSAEAKCCGTKWCIGSQCDLANSNNKCADCESKCGALPGVCCARGNVNCEPTCP